MAKAHPAQFKVLNSQYITPTVFVLEFEQIETPEPFVKFEFKAGQFISVVVPKAGPGGRDLRRAYSIASAPQKTTVEFCVKRVEGGPGTTYLASLKPGDVFSGVAPYGDFVLETTGPRNVCFISTGTGIAPFRSMIHSRDFFQQKLGSVTCLLGVRSEDEILYENELLNVSKQNPNFQYIVALSQPVSPKGSVNHRRLGRVTHYLKETLNAESASITDFYLCGSNAMIQEVKEILTSFSVEKDRIFQEKYY